LLQCHPNIIAINSILVRITDTKRLPSLMDMGKPFDRKTSTSCLKIKDYAR